MKQFIIIAFFMSCTSLFATNYYVAPWGDNNYSGLSWDSAFATLQHAADIVVVGDSVFAADGDYVGFDLRTSGTELLPVVFKADGNDVRITLPNTVTNDGINVEGANWVVIDGFEVIGIPRDGIRLVAGENLVVQNCVVTDNERFGILTGWTPEIKILNNIASGTVEQHGIYVSNSDVPVDSPVIRGNTSFSNNFNGIQINGDIWAGGDGLISNATIENNVAYNNGYKGLSLISMGTSVVCNNLIFDNGINGGAGGIHIVEQVGSTVYSNDNVVVNNTIVEPSIAGIRINADNVGNILFNNICISNQPIVCEGTGNYVDTISNLQSDSVNGIFVDPLIDDYRLAEDSPAIDSGVVAYYGQDAPTQDIEGTNRPQGSGFDIGAYEYFADGVTVNNVSAQICPKFCETFLKDGVAIFNNLKIGDKIRVYDIFGSRVHASGILGGTSYCWSVKNISSGIYFYVIKPYEVEKAMCGKIIVIR